jgi:hypothetical protein
MYKVLAVCAIFVFQSSTAFSQGAFGSMQDAQKTWSAATPEQQAETEQTFRSLGLLPPGAQLSMFADLGKEFCRRGCDIAAGSAIAACKGAPPCVAAAILGRDYCHSRC